jgi:hypothetical protein
VGDALMEGVLAPTAANGDARERDVHTLAIESYARASGSGEDAPPVGNGACERSLDRQ